MNQDLMTELIKRCPLWIYNDKSISRDFVFKDFKDAFTFMTRVAFDVERMDHHPNWTNVYNKVSIILFTHSTGYVTAKDIDLAEVIDKEYIK